MRSTLGPGQAAQEVASREPRRRVDGRLIVLLVVVALYSRGTLAGSLNPVVLRTWTTVFVAIVVQALPFLVLGVLVSGAITALVSPAVLERLLPRSAVLAVPSAALAGAALLGCECASVPIAGRLCARGGAAGCGAGVHAGRPRGEPGRAGCHRGRLPRFVIFCCVADAEALQAVVRGDATPRARDQWLEVEGPWQARPPAAEDDPAHRHQSCTPT